MYYKVKIKKLPKAQQGRTVKTGQQMNGALAIQPTAMGGADIDQYMGKKPVEIQKSLKRVAREEANLEAEGGETAYGDINGDGFTEHYNIEGPRHSSGGVPLNLPDDTFIFSDTRSMLIKDPAMLSRFGKPVADGKKSKGYTPAQLAKQYDINKYRKILQDPDSDVIVKKTAELMIRNYNMKLGALALAQEAKKGFPQGIPMVAQPYMEANGISEEDIMPTYQPRVQQSAPGEIPVNGTAPENPTEEENIYDNSGMEQMPDEDAMMMEQDMEQAPMAQYGYEMPSYMAYGGYIPEAQDGMSVEQMNDYILNNLDKAAIDKPAITDEQRVRLNAMKAMENADWYNAPTGMSKDRIFENGKIQKMNTWYPGLASKQPGNIYHGYPQYQDGGGTGTAALTPEEQKIVETKWNGKTDAYLAYKSAEQAILNDADFRKKLFDQYQKVIEQEANYTGGKKSNWYQALKDRKEDEVIDALLKQEERNARLEAFGLNALETDQPTVKGQNINKQAAELIKNNPGLSDLSFDKGYLSQAAYLAYDDVIKGGEEKQKGIKQTGKSDELKGRESISGIDNASTNTTLGQRLNYTPAVKKETVTKKVLTCQCTDDNGKTYDPGKNEQGQCNDCQGTDRPDLVDVNVEEEAPVVTVPEWTTPDLMNYYGALKDKASLRKYYPWAAPVDMEESPAVYLDPTRELAANSEQANILTQGLAQFVGPQAMSSRASQIQGQGAKQASDVLSRYNNANVQLANQSTQANAGIRNQERAANQAIAKQLYDQTTLTNAMYDKDKRLADSVKRQAFATGWKNAGDIALLNSTSQQYDIDPRTGTVVFTGGKELEPQVNRTFDTLLRGYIEQGFEPKDAIAAAKIAMGQSGNYTGPDIDAIMANAKEGGMYVMGSNIFPFMFY